MTPEQLEERLEEWARWVQDGSAPAQLGYCSTSPGFGEYNHKAQGLLISSERQIEVEATVAELQVLGHGVWDPIRSKWIKKPAKRYLHCAEVLRAEYRAKSTFGDPKFEPPGNSSMKTLEKIGVSKRTYFTKLRLAKHFVDERIN